MNIRLIWLIGCGVLNSLLAQGGFTFINNNKLETVDFCDKTPKAISTNHSVYDYALLEDRLYIVTIDPSGHTPGKEFPTTKLLYSYITSDGFSELSFREISFSHIKNISLSPDQAQLLVSWWDEFLNYNYSIITTTSNHTNSIEKLKGYKVLDWKSNTGLLLVKDGSLFRFNIPEDNFSTLKYRFAFDNEKIINIKETKHGMLVQIKDNSLHLYAIDVNSAQRLYSASSTVLEQDDRFDYIVTNNDNVVVLDKKLIDNQFRYSLIKLDLNGNILAKKDLSKTLNEKAFFMMLSENTKDNRAIVFSKDHLGNNSFYSINMEEMENVEFILKAPYYINVKKLRLR